MKHPSPTRSARHRSAAPASSNGNGHPVILNRAAGNAVSQGKIVRSNNRWRDQYNPLRSLVIARLVTMLEQAERGEHAEIQWLYRFIEKRFPVLRSLVARRRAALLKLDWDIKTVSELPAGFNEAQAAAQQQHLRSLYDGITNIKDAIKQMALAEFRGFTILQKHYADAGAIRELHWLPQWNWVRDGLFGAWYWNPEAQNTSYTTLPKENAIFDPGQIDPVEQGMPRTDFVIRVEDMPINEIAAVAFINTSTADKDWISFIEMFGLPGCVIEMPPNIPQGKEDEYQTAAERVAEASSGAVPNGAKPTFPTAQIRGSAPFKEYLDAKKEDVVLAGTGGKLTMLNDATGIGGSQATEHGDAFDDLAQGEAAEISEVFQRDIDKIALAQAFPGQPVLAYFQIAAEDQEDADALATRINTLKQAGLEVDADEASEKMSLKLTRSAAVVAPGFGPQPQTLQRQPGLANRDSALRASHAALARSLASDLQPLRERLAAILQIDDPALQKQRLKKLRADWDQIKKDIISDPDSARELEQIMAGGFSAALANRMLNAEHGEEDGVWRTVHGSRVFIKTGQSLQDAVQERDAKLAADGHTADDVDDIGDSPVGKQGDWQSLKLADFKAIAGDSAVADTNIEQARQRLIKGFETKDVLGGQIQFNQATLDHWTSETKKSASDLEGRLRRLDQAVETLQRPHEVWRARDRKVYLQVVRDPSGGRRAVQAFVVQDNQVRTFFSGRDLKRVNKLREGELLYAR